MAVGGYAVPAAITGIGIYSAEKTYDMGEDALRNASDNINRFNRDAEEEILFGGGLGGWLFRSF